MIVPQKASQRDGHCGRLGRTPSRGEAALRIYVSLIAGLVLAACTDLPSNVCGVDEDRCDNRCVDLLSDPENCGGCSIECEADESCDDGECVR